MSVTETMIAIAKVERTLAPPAGAKKLASITEEPPADVSVFPTVINLESDVDVDERSAGTGAKASRSMRYFVEVHVLFAPSADPKMAYRERRLWLAPLLDLFQDNPTLDGKVTSSDVKGADHEPYGWNGTDYVAINLRLEVLDDE